MPIQVKLVIEGRQQLQDFLRKFPLFVRQSIDVYVRGVVDASVKRLQNYPPKPAGSKYVRTYLLKRSFGTRQTRLGRWVFSNSAPYAGWVIGDQQARHMGHWTKARVVAEEESVRQLPILVSELTRMGKV